MERLEHAVANTDGNVLAISEFLNEPVTKVFKNMRRFQVDPMITPQKLTLENVKKILETFALNDAAVLLGASYNTLYVFATRHNLWKRNDGGT